MLASCDVAFALSGVITNASAGVDDATRSTGPALASQFRFAATTDESAGDTGPAVAVSTGGGVFARSQAPALRRLRKSELARKSFMPRNLD